MILLIFKKIAFSFHKRIYVINACLGWSSKPIVRVIRIYIVFLFLLFYLKKADAFFSFHGNIEVLK